MNPKSVQAARFSLRRWSQRKLESARAEVPAPAQAAPPPVDASAAAQTPAGTAHSALERTGSSSISTLSANAELPAIESLTIDSDFVPFFKPQVDESIKRAALKQLFRDPRFNIMDGLDTYIDDYTQPDPIPSAMLEDLMQRRIFFPPSVEGDPRERAIDDPAGDRVASSAEAIAPPLTPVAPEAPIAPVAQVAAVVPIASVALAASADATQDATDSGVSRVESGVDAKADKP
ncbi:MAG TPA: DUF3306 domain-containing protein [Casimicrobiaceae bacterium]|nr:DUF3306 domain-containing protein [Casimicrobiaceae bacterium]